MTPAVLALQQAGVTFRTVEYEHDPETTDFGAEAVRELGVDAAQVFKTLLAQLSDGEVVVAVVSVTSLVDLKALARAAGAKRATMADAALAERRSGYVVGGISPFGQRQTHRTFVDESAQALAELHMSGGRRGLEIVVAPDALVSVLDATFACLAG